jgi:hypothetical protein
VRGDRGGGGARAGVAVGPANAQVKLLRPITLHICPLRARIRDTQAVAVAGLSPLRGVDPPQSPITGPVAQARSPPEAPSAGRSRDSVPRPGTTVDSGHRPASEQPVQAAIFPRLCRDRRASGARRRRPGGVGRRRGCVDLLRRCDPERKEPEMDAVAAGPALQRQAARTPTLSGGDHSSLDSARKGERACEDALSSG